MIIAKNLKSVYEKHKQEIHKLVALDQNKPIGFDELEYSFSDLQGRKYYSFPESTSLPIERLAKIEECKALMSSGLHHGTIQEICGLMDEILSKIVNTGLDNEVKKHGSKNIGKLSVLIKELQEREKTFIPIELFYAFLSHQLVREDENPYVVNNSIHLDKIASLMDLNEKIGGFFFGQKELKLLRNLLNLSESEWNEYWQASKLYHQARSKALKTFLFEVEY